MMEVGDGVFEVLATAGNNRLGGDDFDARIMEYIASEFQRENGIDLRKDQHGHAAPEGSRREGQDRVVRRYVQPTSTCPSLLPTRPAPSIWTIDADPRQVRRADRRSGGKDRRPDGSGAARTPACPASQIRARSLLVGGSTRIPAVQAAVKRHHRQGTQFKGINPDECVAIGACHAGQAYWAVEVKGAAAAGCNAPVAGH